MSGAIVINAKGKVCIERSTSEREKCHECDATLAATGLRMGFLSSPATDTTSTTTHWFHPECFARLYRTAAIGEIQQSIGWCKLNANDKNTIVNIFDDKTQQQNKSATDTMWKQDEKQSVTSVHSLFVYQQHSRDNSFEQFCIVCDKVANISSNLSKTNVFRQFFEKGTNGRKFEGNLYVWTKLLLPHEMSQVFNLQNKRLVQICAALFKANEKAMLTDLENGNVSATIQTYFEQNYVPAKKSELDVLTVDDWLEKLTKLSHRAEQIEHFRKICKRATAIELRQIIRLIKRDLQMNVGVKLVLDAFNPKAYAIYQSSRDLKSIVNMYERRQFVAPPPTMLASIFTKTNTTSGSITVRAKSSSSAARGKTVAPASGGKATVSSLNKVGVQLMCPISPMLGEACKNVDKAIEKCPDGMICEIKYDGERVQLHKSGTDFKFFSRNLKPVMEHKVEPCKQYILDAFPDAEALILDAELIIVDMITGQLLPFGTLGIHKRAEFKTGVVCLFVFDCIFYNGNDMTRKPLGERRKLLERIMKPIKNHVQLSDYNLVHTKKELNLKIAEVLQLGLEGLVLKNINGIYEPGKRHWLKVKKDYLFDGQMADAADLVVLGAWYGTGKNGGKLSIFLMGCCDRSMPLSVPSVSPKCRNNVWCTVTKVHSGLDDKTMSRLQKQLTPLMVRADAENTPTWLNCKKPMIPDLLAKNPDDMPVWEIVGAEFSRANIHTASGISIRFPRITRLRDDKSANEATTLQELEQLYANSKASIDVGLLVDNDDDNNDTNDGNDNNRDKLKYPKGDTVTVTVASTSSTSPLSTAGNRQSLQRINQGVGHSNKPNDIMPPMTNKSAPHKNHNVPSTIMPPPLLSSTLASPQRANAQGTTRSPPAVAVRPPPSSMLTIGDGLRQTLIAPKLLTTVQETEQQPTYKKVKGKLFFTKTDDKDEDEDDDFDDDFSDGVNNIDKYAYAHRNVDNGDSGKKEQTIVANEKLVHTKKFTVGKHKIALPSDASHLMAKKCRYSLDNNEQELSKFDGVHQQQLKRSHKSAKEMQQNSGGGGDGVPKLRTGGAASPNTATIVGGRTATTSDVRKQQPMPDKNNAPDIAKTASAHPFADVRLYIPKKLRDNIRRMGNELERFIENGGQIMCERIESRQCTHALHADDALADNLDDFRILFVPECRHIQREWLTECVDTGQLVAVNKYPVLLRTSKSTKH